MNIRTISLWLVLFALSAITRIGFSLEDESAYTVGCLPKKTVEKPSSVCVPCHQDSSTRWALFQNQPCTSYCMTCHQKTLERHHTVGTVLTEKPIEPLKLTAEKKTACFTCHNLSRMRFDASRWKAASLYDRLFHDEERYKTYFLSERNDHGQLCLSCH